LYFVGPNVRAGGERIISDFRLKNSKSRIGIGLAALGRPGYINLGHAKDFHGNYDPQEMEKHAHEVLDAAWEGGVRYFDAARSYGKAEKFLGSWLRKRKISADDVTVASKWGYTYTANWQVDADTHEVKDHSLERLLVQWNESYSILGDYIDIYYIHSATKESGVLENKDVLQQLHNLSKQRILIGLTVSGTAQAQTIEQALKIKFDGEPLFKCVQATWNLLEQSTNSILQIAHDQGMKVIIKEALANGRLTDRNDDPAFSEKRKLLEEELKRTKTPIDALSIAAALAQPWADFVLSGAATVDQLRSNLTALEIQLDPQTLNRMFALAESSEEYWTYRSKLPWN
jgi:aryl-alcohol dehydrogenase-like predicted oxidoreductase